MISTKQRNHKRYYQLHKCWDIQGDGGRHASDTSGSTTLSTHLIVRVGAGRVGRLPQHQQRGLVAEPHDELARRVRPCARTQTRHDTTLKLMVHQQYVP